MTLFPAPSYYKVVVYYFLNVLANLLSHRETAERHNENEIFVQLPQQCQKITIYVMTYKNRYPNQNTFPFCLLLIHSVLFAMLKT